MSVTLLGMFEVAVDGIPRRVSASAQRLVAYVALHGRSVGRSRAAGVLWPEVREERALANLRSTLWRLRAIAPILDSRGGRLALAVGVRVDLEQRMAAAEGLLRAPQTADPASLHALRLNGELLADWEDDWVTAARERIHQLRLHALEQLCERLADQGEFGLAVDAGLAATMDEPFRESAHIALIRAYLAEGNRMDALRHFEWYRRMLADELGLSPSRRMVDLIDQATPGRRRWPAKRPATDR